MHSLPNAAGWLALDIPRGLAALMAAFQLRDKDYAILKTLSHQEWVDLLAFCDLAHLTLPLARLQPDCLPSWVEERLQTNISDNARRFQRVKNTYNEAAEVLRRAEVPFVVIKGFTQTPDFVEDPRLRSQSDIDLYCPAEHIPAARTALQSIGYEPHGGIDYSRADHTPTMVRLGDWTWKGNHFDPEMPLSIELHFCLWNEAVAMFRIPGIDAFWERRRIAAIEDISFPALSPVDHLGYFSLHILRGVLAGDWIIHHVLELATFLHSHAGDDTFWNAWHETHDASLRALQALAFYYARAWFSCDLHQLAATEIANLSAAHRRWLHQFSSSTLEGMSSPNKDSVWLHMTLLNSHQSKFALLKRAFIPVHISGINSPAVRVKNRLPRDQGGNPFRMYAAYLASRCASYSYLTLATILHGIRWRFSTN